MQKIIIFLSLSIFLFSCNSSSSSATDMDLMDMDMMDEDIMDGDQISPCNPNPCTEPNRNKCVITNNRAVCECNKDYTLENDMCINEKRVDCDETKNPPNSMNIVEKVVIHYTTAAGWTKPSACRWECNDGFYKIDNTCSSQFRDISVSRSHSCAIKKLDDTLWCWGSNDFGQFGNGTNTSSALPIKINDTAWYKVSVGYFYTCAIKDDPRTLYCWGRDDSGQTGKGSLGNTNTPQMISNENWQRLTSGEDHSCAIKYSDESLWCWGKNNRGQIGDNTLENKLAPVKITEDIWIEVSAGNDSTCGIKNTLDTLFCWGDNSDGQLGLGNYANVIIPEQVGTRTYKKISIKETTACALDDSNGYPWCWGDNTYGQVGLNSETDNYTTPEQVNSVSYDDLSVSDSTFFYKDDGTYVAFGLNSFGQLGSGNRDITRSPLVPNSMKFSQISTSNNLTCGIEKTTETLYCTGFNFYGNLGYGKAGRKLIPTKVDDSVWHDATASDGTTCGIKNDSNLYCFGLILPLTGSELAFNDLQKLPKMIDYGTFDSVECNKTSCLSKLTNDLELYGFGNNLNGQLGTGNKNNVESPLQVESGQVRFNIYSVGESFSCALKNDSYTPSCWGSNFSGQLGTGTDITESLIPVNVSTTDPFLNIATGNSHTCGIRRTDNRLMCWGNNQYGQLGLGNMSDYNTPQLLPIDLEFKDVTAGSYYTCAVTMDNKLYCFGINNFGQLGDGTIENKNTPTLIQGNFLDVESISFHTCARSHPDQNLYCWGRNDFGQLGDNTLLNKLTPTLISDDIWAKILPGTAYTCGIKTMGNSLWCWGGNQYGQLGNEDAFMLSPIKVAE
jgi:alpha-tubulin suppressor-like RCC1 family protein